MSTKQYTPQYIQIYRYIYTNHVFPHFHAFSLLAIITTFAVLQLFKIIPIFILFFSLVYTVLYLKLPSSFWLVVLHYSVTVCTICLKNLLHYISSHMISKYFVLVIHWISLNNLDIKNCFFPINSLLHLCLLMTCPFHFSSVFIKLQL